MRDKDDILIWEAAESGQYGILMEDLYFVQHTRAELRELHDDDELEIRDISTHTDTLIWVKSRDTRTNSPYHPKEYWIGEVARDHLGLRTVHANEIWQRMEMGHQKGTVLKTIPSKVKDFRDSLQSSDSPYSHRVISTPTGAYGPNTIVAAPIAKEYIDWDERKVGQTMLTDM